MDLNRVSLLAIGLACASSAVGATSNQAEEIVRRSVVNTNADWAAAPQFDYTERDVITQNGKRTVKTYQVLMIEGSTYNKLIALNGKQLTGSQADAEEGKLRQEIERRRSESPDVRHKRVAKYQAERRQDHELMTEMVKAFDFALNGQADVNGRQCFVLDANPKAGYRPPNRDTQVLKAMRGKLWVDANEYQWVKVHAEVFRPVNFGLIFAQVKPGTSFTLEQRPVSGKLWLPSHFTTSVKARVFLSSRNSLDDEVYSDYRRSGTAEATQARK